jgi:S-adenosylmethionine hydrolase
LRDYTEMGNRILTLLTDFGFSDVYVGVLKGVITQINPRLTVIDLTHQVPPQNVAAGSFCLFSAYSYFPTGTVHIAVVDPGVGSHRRGVAIQFAAGFLVGPDNGLFSRVLHQSPAQAAVELTNPDYWRSPQPSTTFHGRDIFASVGAHLASGVPLEALGTAIDLTTLVQLSLPEYRLTDTGVEGYIQYVDHFGNLITNIPGTVVQGKPWWVEAAGSIIPGEQTYSDRLVGNLIALVGSHGCIEIALNQGNAQARLSLGTGDAVQVMLDLAVSH